MVDFIPELCRLGMVVAIGHSGADYETARKAIANGAMGATHTSNAMRLLHQHEPAIWGAVLEDDKVYCEMICDGRHLHPGTVRLILKTKGTDRVVAVTDYADGFKCFLGLRTGCENTHIRFCHNFIPHTWKTQARMTPAAKFDLTLKTICF